MSSSLRPLTTRELLDRAAQMYLQNFILFVGIAALPYLCCLVVNLSFLAAIPKFSEILADSAINGAKWFHNSFPSIPVPVLKKAVQVFVFTSSTIYFTPFFLQLLAGAIVTAATSIGISEIYSGRQTTIATCYASLKGRFGKVVYAFAALSLRTVAGFLLFVIPGVYWFARDGLALPATALEDIKGHEACARSAALTKGSIRRILAIYFVFAVLQYEFRSVVGLVLFFIYPVPDKIAIAFASNTVSWVWTAVSLSVTTPFIAIALALAYYDQRVRVEAFNLETMMSDAQQASSVPNPLCVTP